MLMLRCAVNSLTKRCFASVFATALLATCSFAAAAEKEIPDDAIRKFQEETKDIKNQVLPLGRLVVSQRGGKTIITSDNGRYRFQAPIIDTWTKLEINSYEDAVFSSEHLPMENIGLKSEMLAPLIYGDNAEQKVLVFLSPDDPASRRFLNELPSLKDRFKFELVVVPANSTPTKWAASFSCVDDEEQALDALLSGKGINNLQFAAGCDLQMLNNRMLAFRLLGFYDLPTVIAPSSRLSIGDRADGWKKFLMENMQ